MEWWRKLTLDHREIPFGHLCFTTGWKYGARTSLSPLGKSLKMFIGISKQSFSKLKIQVLDTLLVLAMGSLLIKIMAMEKVVKYMFKVQESPSHLTS